MLHLTQPALSMSFPASEETCHFFLPFSLSQLSCRRSASKILLYYDIFIKCFQTFLNTLIMNWRFDISLNTIYYWGAQNKHKNPCNQSKLVFKPIWLVRFQIKYSRDTKETFYTILFTSFFILKMSSFFLSFWFYWRSTKFPY